MKNTYRALSAVGFLSKRYTHKFLFIAFLGIHVPLIAVVLFICTGIMNISTMNVVLLTLFATLLASGLTLYILNGLLWPLHAGKRALDAYLVKNEQPLLPTHYKDEAGMLMTSIQQTIEKLDSLMEEKKDLISLFSHDMRTPTTQMLGLSRMIKEEDDVTKIKEYLGVLENVADKQLVMLTDILALLRTDNLTDDKEFEVFGVQDWIKDCTRHLLVSAAQKNITFVLSIDHAPCSVKGEKTLLTEALCNVLTNAIKFSYHNGQININATSVDGKCKIDVTDHGVGFQNAIAKKLFEKFTKHGKAGTAGEQTTGIGLYLTKTILHKHNGNITAFSPGHEQGATFTLRCLVSKTFQLCYTSSSQQAAFLLVFL